ncbi:uncharacterized protein TRAVEDRAFT_52171 [Trametes versicolor FP-101664 SS1]|uniref:uncharacterized protein n=1 Tax=Trametes versicolor (strain FP-101664) TaxID=717944 RepID=UPI0004624141|nr:uncharacterized protein TRAVEDRAFT_52171 [Trametes versicolor FP-101664 SS1]EIW54466.1 hypothetical protein TRAVEDRAFT_52171 [Trametes versicolor FP-101664 SS1]
MGLSEIMKAAFDYMFGLQLKTQPLEEDHGGHTPTLGGISHAFDEEWETMALPHPFFSLTGQVPAHIISTWR